jgi:cytochrome c biogenesis protein ResB
MCRRRQLARISPLELTRIKTDNDTAKQRIKYYQTRDKQTTRRQFHRVKLAAKRGGKKKNE